MERIAATLETALRHRAALTTAVRFMSAACVASAILSVLALSVAVWALTSKPESRYFATRTGGQLVQLVPLDQPHLADSQVVNFAVDAMTRAFSLDFARYREELADLEPFFTERGYKAFLAELQSSGTLELITNRRMTGSAVANGGVVVAKGIGGGGQYVWRVEVPLVTTYQSSSEEQKQRTTYLVEIIRVPTWQTDLGIAILRLVGQAQRG
ncbi:MAG: type IVB secretion system apparatus protein IcmL/DotI [Rhodobacteraceae bacterium]|nr:type IVB secretion system apparatus protein IcmL/DotI [Paracoccaceae bacterium]MCY4196581.1 type IVB secretion system apparatus protein IcmL/DotI [Paracoccaceae bacterium]MCY4327810.1 type IVB secretion system apparatus protein IcmL/DotI [Paracoccaceae bacterium]